VRLRVGCAAAKLFSALHPERRPTSSANRETHLPGKTTNWRPHRCDGSLTRRTLSGINADRADHVEIERLLALATCHSAGEGCHSRSVGGALRPRLFSKRRATPDQTHLCVRTSMYALLACPRTCRKYALLNGRDINSNPCVVRPVHALCMRPPIRTPVFVIYAPPPNWLLSLLNRRSRTPFLRLPRLCVRRRLFSRARTDSACGRSRSSRVAGLAVTRCGFAMARSRVDPAWR